MKSLTRITRLSTRLTSSSTTCRPTISIRCLHNTPPTPAEEDLTFAQRYRKKIYGKDAEGPADPYKELTPEELEKREIARLEAEEGERKAEVRKQKKLSVHDAESGYVPAYDAREMKIVGTRGGFQKREFDVKARVWRFLLTRLKEPEQITVALRRAVIETYTQAIQASKPGKANVHYRGPEYLTEFVGVTTTNRGESFTFDYKKPELLNRITEYGKKLEPVREDQSLVEGLEKVKLEEDGWLGLRLGGEGMKFAILKRAQQLTGIPLQDPVIDRLDTVRDMHAQFQKVAGQSNTAKLAPALAENEELGEALNVAIHQYQLKFTDKERAIGRLETIPIMMAGRVRKEGEIIGKGVGREGRKRVSRSMLRLRARKIKGYGVTGIDRRGAPAAVPEETGEELSEQAFTPS